MKFSCVVALSLFASATAAEVKASNLRATAVEPLVASATIATMVMVPGIKTGTGEDHAPTLEKCMVEAYNKHDMMGYKMESFRAGKEVDIPDDIDSQLITGRGTAEAVFWGGSGSYRCPSRICGDDDSMGLTALGLFQSLASPSVAKLHAEFEEDLCACLQDSGVKAFKHAKECSVEYKYNPTPPVLGAGDANLTFPPPTVTGVQVPVKTVSLTSEEESSVLANTGISTVVVVQDIKTGTGEDHAPTLEKCMLKAYNKRNMDGYKMESFRAGKEVDVPYDMDSQLTTGRGTAEAVFWGGSGSYRCPSRICGDDDSMGFTALAFLQSLDSASAANLHAEFEEDLCACLQDSGVKAYKHAKECSVDYMNSPMPPAIEEVKTVSVTSGSSNEGINTMVVVPGIKTGTGEDHAPTLEKCMVEAYNKHDMDGYKMESFRAGKEVDVPDDSGRNSATAYHWGGSGSYRCPSRICGDDDSMGFTALEFFNQISLAGSSAAELHGKFEKSLCTCLDKSGLKAYKKANNCVVQYMYTPPTPPASQE